MELKRENFLQRSSSSVGERLQNKLTVAIRLIMNLTNRIPQPDGVKSSV